MEEKKVKVVFEFDKDYIKSVFFLMKEKLSDDLWNKLVENEIILSDDDLGEQSTQVNLAIMALSIAKVASINDL